MPNRIIRDGICSSETINGLSPDQEVLFYRLIVVADDFGRFDGRLSIVKSSCFPLREISTQKMEASLAALAKATLIRRYHVDGKPFLLIAKWDQHQRIRNARSKYPPPDGSDSPSSASNPPQVDKSTEIQQSATNQHVSGNGSNSRSIDSGSPRLAPRAGAESESESESESNPNPNPTRAGAPGGVRPEVWEAWRRHRGQSLTPDAVRLQTAKLVELAKHGNDPNEVIEQSICNGWTGLFQVGKPRGSTPPKRHRSDAIDEAIRKGNNRKENNDGRIIDGVAERVGSATVVSLPSHLREQG